LSKKKFQWLRLKRKILRKKNYLFKFIYFFPFANNKENQKRMKILINLETLLCLLPLESWDKALSQDCEDTLTKWQSVFLICSQTITIESFLLKLTLDYMKCTVYTDFSDSGNLGLVHFKIRNKNISIKAVRLATSPLWI
jgi:hypothetical protein